MKADSPSPRFHGVTPCSPGLITFGLKSLICCRKAGDEASYPRFDKIFPRCAFRPCRKTFKKIIFRRGKVDGRGLFHPTNLKNSQRRNQILLPVSLNLPFDSSNTSRTVETCENKLTAIIAANAHLHKLDLHISKTKLPSFSPSKYET